MAAPTLHARRALPPRFPVASLGLLVTAGALVAFASIRWEAGHAAAAALLAAAAVAYVLAWGLERPRVPMRAPLALSAASAIALAAMAEAWFAGAAGSARIVAVGLFATLVAVGPAAGLLLNGRRRPARAAFAAVTAMAILAVAEAAIVAGPLETVPPLALAVGSALAATGLEEPIYMEARE